MGQVLLDMALVSQCEVEQCGYNVSRNCHAKAITIGDDLNPGCDTYFQCQSHSLETKRIAGVGACKISTCQSNNDFECTAKNISVGYTGGEVKCLTFEIKP